MNEEVRNLEFYEEGSALRHLATIKELFATHLALLWMSVSTLDASEKRLTPSQKEKLVFLQKTIKGLISSQHLLSEICLIVNNREDNQGRKTTNADLKAAFDTFEQDKSPSQICQKVQTLQELYLVIHYHFAEKAGNRGIIHELGNDSNEVLFVKESERAGGINLLDNISADKSNMGGARRKTTLPENYKYSPEKKDQMSKQPLFKKEINEDGAVSDVESEAAFAANDDVDKDFAYLRYHLQQNPQGKEWKTLVQEEHSNHKIQIKG